MYSLIDPRFNSLGRLLCRVLLILDLTVLVGFYVVLSILAITVCHLFGVLTQFWYQSCRCCFGITLMMVIVWLWQFALIGNSSIVDLMAVFVFVWHSLSVGVWHLLYTAVLALVSQSSATQYCNSNGAVYRTDVRRWEQLFCVRNIA